MKTPQIVIWRYQILVGYKRLEKNIAMGDAESGEDKWYLCPVYPRDGPHWLLSEETKQDLWDWQVRRWDWEREQEE